MRHKILKKLLDNRTGYGKVALRKETENDPTDN